VVWKLRCIFFDIYTCKYRKDIWKRFFSLLVNITPIQQLAFCDIRWTVLWDVIKMITTHWCSTRRHFTTIINPVICICPTHLRPVYVTQIYTLVEWALYNVIEPVQAWPMYVIQTYAIKTCLFNTKQLNRYEYWLYHMQPRQ